MTARISVPAEKVRTREQILEGQVILRGHVWVACRNCGGSGAYPSSMTPPGMCRFYCWAKPHTDQLAAAMGAPPPAKDRTDPTFGRRPVELEKFVKREQAADRADYRRQVRWELDAPLREQAARAQAEREEAARIEQARIAADVAARKAVSQYVGAIGERIDLEVTVTRVASYEARPFNSFSGNTVTRYVVTLRDVDGNVFVWFSDYRREQGETLKIRATVKEHKAYLDERQTVLQRVKELAVAN